MKLVGMLDSPYVRRVAISLQLLGLPFEHQSLSVFRGWDAFRAINPVVKAPTLVCDDGTVLMDSQLMLEYAARLAPSRRLLPDAPADLARDLRIAGLALAATEKVVQVVYEHLLRPEDKRHAPWMDRVRLQVAAAFAGLEAELAARPLVAEEAALTQGGVAAAVAWTFPLAARPGEVDPAAHPALAAFTAAAEALPAFRRAPHGEGTVLPA